MRVLILTCNTGGGHNAVAAALAESFRRLGVSSDTADGLSFISQKASRFVSKWHTRFYRRYPKLYKAGYMSAENDAESNDRDNPVYRYMARGARRLDRAIQDGGYDAVVCVHVIPAMMMTELRRQHETGPVFCFVATDYTCSPTVGACTPDICVIPHQELADEFVSCGIARDTLLPAGIPVRSAFRQRGDRAAARKALGLPETGRHIVLMSGSIGCGPMADIAAELEKRGHVFRSSHSDTETVLHAYMEWGEEAPARFNGMFALAIWDKARRRLFLARDRFGEKPLFWAAHKDGFAFASEVQALFHWPLFSGRLHAANVQRYLAWGYCTADRTIFEACPPVPA